MARHVFGGRLSYSGFGGEGLQVRDILHADDLFDLIRMQVAEFSRRDGAVRNVGGGLDVSVSLRELTQHCADLTGRKLDIGQDPDTHPADIPWYVSDCRQVTQDCGWRPKIAA
jgi:CDP-paratose 2-epimerase